MLKKMNLKIACLLASAAFGASFALSATAGSYEQCHYQCKYAPAEVYNSCMAGCTRNG